MCAAVAPRALNKISIRLSTRLVEGARWLSRPGVLGKSDLLARLAALAAENTLLIRMPYWTE